MSEALIRAQVKAILEGVSGIGVVHDYERTSQSLADYLELMSAGQGAEKKVNGWTITRTGTPAGASMGSVERNHTFRIHGIYALNDAEASEKTFQAFVEAVFSAFLGNPLLNGTAIDSDPVNVDSVDRDELGGRAYHVADLSITVKEEVAG